MTFGPDAGMGASNSSVDTGRPGNRWLFSSVPISRYGTQ